MRLRFSRKTLGIPYAVFLLFFVIIPMLVIIFYAFTDKEMHISFENFIRFFSDRPVLMSTTTQENLPVPATFSKSSERFCAEVSLASIRLPKGAR